MEFENLPQKMARFIPLHSVFSATSLRTQTPPVCELLEFRDAVTMQR